MKKYLLIFLVLTVLFCTAGCNKGAKNPAAPTVTRADGTTAELVDLTAMSSTMVYSEVYNMLSAPEQYRGKLVRMQGTMSTYKDTESGKEYHSCIIADATACCQQGLEFVLTEGLYPKDGRTVTVEGLFGTYFEGENQYCQLTDAVLCR